MKTYKQLVNNILIRLREKEIVTINDNSYSKLIGLFVHDAIESVESAWNWSGLRDNITIATAVGQSSYAITGSGDKSTVLSIVNATSTSFMVYKSAIEFTDIFLNPNPAQATPNCYTFDGLDTNGDTKIKLYPVPDAVYSITVRLVKRSPDILADTDTVKVPFLPVQAMAYAMALEERGEDGGVSPVSAKALAQGYLSDAIALDAGKHPEDTLWEAV